MIFDERAIWPSTPAAFGLGMLMLTAAAGCGEEFGAGFGGGGATSTATTSTSTGSGGATSTTTTSTGGNGQGGTGAVGGGGSGDGGEAGAGGGSVTLPCQPGWDFTPTPPTEGQNFQVVYHTSVPGSYAYVKFLVDGTGTPYVTDPDVIGGTPPYQGEYAWRATVSQHQAGPLDFQFRENCNPGGICSLISTCSVMVAPAAQ